MRTCESVVGLARELGVNWRLLYRWKEQLSQAAQEEDPTAARERALQQEVANLKTTLADQVLKADFFRGALQRIEARRQSGSASGKPASINSFTK
jgi:transposase-like protein